MEVREKRAIGDPDMAEPGATQPRPLEASTGTPLCESPIRLGFVGLRNIGMNHVRRALKLDGIKVTALADADPERFEQAKEEFEVDAGFTDAKALFEQAEVDAVVLAVPNHLHVPFSIAAMEAGRHVLVEKPLAPTAAEARTVIPVRDRTGCVLAVGMNQRFRAQARAAKQLIASGRLGDVKFCRARWTRPAGMDKKGIAARGPWQFLRERGGGPLLDLGIHKLDVALYILGFPKVTEVMGTATSTVANRYAKSLGLECDVEEYAWGCLRLEGHGLMELSAALDDPSCTEETQQTFIACEGGYIVQERGGFRAAIYDETGAPQPIELSTDDGGSETSVEHLVRVLQGREPLCSTPEQAVLGLELLEAMQRSIEENRTISLH